MTPVADPFMADARPTGLQKGRGGFLRSADDAPYVTDPTGALVKSGERKGQVARLKYGSPSNRGREIENDAGLVKYRQRLSFLGIGMDTALAEQCRDLVVMDADSEEFRHAADKIAVEADRLTRSWLAADRGSHGHKICEVFDLSIGWVAGWPSPIDHLIESGEALGLSEAVQRQVAIAWAAMLATNGLEILAIEASCVDDRWRLAGTLDRIVRTTRALTFVKKSGELVVIPAGTVLILDIKFGKCRLAHPIQIASYAQSVPYVTETETRGVWPWPIDQTHALIAHGDFGDDTRPVTIELVWVDLVAGREHGGECVVQAKAWAARDDVFSVAQIVEGADSSPNGRRSAPSTPADDYIAKHYVDVPPALQEIVKASLAPSIPLTWPKCQTCRDVLATCEDVLALANGRLDVTAASQYHVANSQAPDRLALVDARAALCATPDEGADWSDDAHAPLWAALGDLFDTLDTVARSWRGELASQAKRRGVDFLAQGGRTERRYHINKAVIAWALAFGGDDELSIADDGGTHATNILRELLAHIIGDVALYPGVEPGHALGSLNAAEAERFAAHIDAYLAPYPAA